MIHKLASQRIDTSLLRSSKNLGVKTESKREVILRASKEHKAGINAQENRDLIRDLSYAIDSESDGSESSADQIQVESSIPARGPTLGSGLKRAFETDADGNPVIPKRRRLVTRRKFSSREEEPPWEGFSSPSDGNISDADSHSSGADEESEVDPEVASSSRSYSMSQGSTSDGDDAHQNLEKRKERSSAFKAWATQQFNEVLGFTPTTSADAATNAHKISIENIKPREPEQDPLPQELQIASANPSRKAFSVQVNRSPEIQEARLKLPIVAEEQKIMEAVYNNSTVVIWGATGSGKTTQVPQFLYEGGFGNSQSPMPGMIGMTQPRRVAAVSMAKRVSEELGELSGKVSYQIRFESSVSNKTVIKFMTDGILIREIANDFALLKYSAVIIDEAHERSVNTDILIGMVSRIVDLRKSMSKDDLNITPLKLIIMSATLRIADFMDNPILFRSGPPPLLQAEGRQYPVTIHFARRTQRDYIEEAFQKVSRGHKKLPPGGMLVFLTGQNEITTLAKKLRTSFTSRQAAQVSHPKVRIAANEAPLEVEDVDLGGVSSDNDRNGDPFDDSSGDSQDEEDKAFEFGERATTTSDVHVLPLYSQLQTQDQLRVFEPPPEGSRLIVLATNVAETSITIPGIRYVFDCGRAKERKYDQSTGVQSFEIGWISKASASQRAGRAGRTGPGHCYRLYSSAVFERDFVEHAQPEILRMPVEGVVLQLKSMDLQHVVNFPFPTPPDRQSLAKAERLLTYLGAISGDGKITPIGRELSIYPLSPRYSKMLVIGHQHGCMPYTIAMVAALAVQDIFIPENQLELSPLPRDTEATYTNSDRLEDTAREQRRRIYNRVHHQFSSKSKTSDALKALTATCAYAYAPDPPLFCTEMFLNPKSLKEATSLRHQLSIIVQTNHPTLMPDYNPRLPPPSSKQLIALQQILAAAFIDHIAIRADLSPSPPELPRKPSRAIDVSYLPLFPSHTGKATDLIDIAVFIHPSSVLAHLSPKDLPQYIVYSHLQRGTPATITGSKTPKTRMHALATIGGKQITALAKDTPLLRYGKPIGKVDDKGKTRECWVVPELVGEIGRAGWPLPALRVVQKKAPKEGWIVERIIT